MGELKGSLRKWTTEYHFARNNRIVFKVKRPGGTVRKYPHPEQAEHCLGVWFLFCNYFLKGVFEYES